MTTFFDVDSPSASFEEAPMELQQLGDRLRRQLNAMRRWNDGVGLTLALDDPSGGGDDRRQAALRTHQAMVTRANRAIEDSVDVLLSPRPLALVVHGNAWMRARLCQGLEDIGLRVVAGCDDAPEALGVAIVEQPDVVVLDDRMPSASALELLGELLDHSTAVVGAQVGSEDEMGELLDAGASAVFSRRVPPAVIVEALNALARGRASIPVQVR